MAKHLTQNDVKKIVRMLHEWRYELTWNLLVDACEEKLGISTTRQSLHRKFEIKETYKQTKERLKVKGQYYARPNSIDVAHKRIEQLAEKVVALERANEALLERFVRWQYNALSRGLTMEQLDRPLPPQDFGTSTKSAK
ncbi:hypothetical protein [Marinobacter nauticus]|uniref:hypothetical protein n=1 Tax=Marinobacter nauticus TaxID=2743 RepID=UPI000EAF54AD|nr:hypothetical protein [Marinobacter nauticus]RKR70993.1 hypothetical protein C7436_3478 [Marinobacter nauticus]